MRNPTSRTRQVLIAVAAVAALAVVGCSDEDKRELGEVDVRDSLSAQVAAAADTEGLELDGDPECTATIAVDGTVDGTCTGTTTSGAAVTGTYTGTADIDAETCVADMTLTLDGTATTESGVDCFATG